MKRAAEVVRRQHALGVARDVALQARFEAGAHRVAADEHRHRVEDLQRLRLLELRPEVADADRRVVRQVDQRNAAGRQLLRRQPLEPELVGLHDRGGGVREARVGVRVADAQLVDDRGPMHAVPAGADVVVAVVLLALVAVGFDDARRESARGRSAAAAGCSGRRTGCWRRRRSRCGSRPCACSRCPAPDRRSCRRRGRTS